MSDEKNRDDVEEIVAGELCKCEHCAEVAEQVEPIVRMMEEAGEKLKGFHGDFLIMLADVLIYSVRHDFTSAARCMGALDAAKTLMGHIMRTESLRSLMSMPMMVKLPKGMMDSIAEASEGMPPGMPPPSGSIPARVVRGTGRISHGTS